MASTQLPGNMGTIDWTNWVRGLAAASIGGGAGAVTSGFGNIIVDPNDFNIHSGKLYQVMAACFLINGLLAMMAFLHAQPIPALVARSESTRTEPDGTVTVKHKEVTVPAPPALTEKKDG